MKRILVCLAACAAIACASNGHHVADPVTNDPGLTDPSHPPSMGGLVIESGGAGMNAIVYHADGPGPHPTLLLLHGLPGEERNLDLAQAVRRAGWNVLFFHYRGAWGSEGTFSFSNALEDVAAAVALASSAGFATDHRADPQRVALAGHSMGGFLALTVGSERDDVDCVASFSGANMGLRASLRGAEAEAAAERLHPLTPPLAGASGASLVREIQQNAERFDLLRRAPALAGKPLLLVAGAWDRVTPVDAHHAPLVAALEAAGAERLTTLRLDADHAYSSRRITLARALVAWLDGACGG